MKIGDLFCNSAAPDFAGKGAFDTRKFRQNGGDTGKPPYFDTVWDRDEYRQPCKVQRAFVSADWFPDWLGWKRQADAALCAIIGGKVEYFGSAVRSAEGYPISGEPRYLIEDGLGLFGKPDTAIWINACCPNEAEFAEAVAEAKNVINQRRELYKRNSSIPATLDAERPHYDPMSNITAGTVRELFN